MHGSGISSTGERESYPPRRNHPDLGVSGVRYYDTVVKYQLEYDKEVGMIKWQTHNGRCVPDDT